MSDFRLPTSDFRSLIYDRTRRYRNMSLFNQYTSGLGVDISEHHVRFAKVNLLNKIQWLHEINLPEGLVVDERIVKTDELKKIIDDALKKTPLNNSKIKTTLLMPESRVFSAHGDLLKAQQDIPVPFENAQIAVSGETIYAMEKSVFDSFKSVFDLPHFTLVTSEANTKSIWRLIKFLGSKEIFPKNDKNLIGIVDIGHSWINISLYTAAGATMFSRSFSYSGALSKAVESVVGTIKETVVYFLQEKREVGTFILAGVEAEDQRIEEKDLVIKRIGEVVKVADHSSKEIHTYGAAIGAALRTVHLRRDAYQYNFLK